MFRFDVWLFAAGVIVANSVAASGAVTVAESDWDDGTFQGWTVEHSTVSGGNYALSAGNPGGAISFTDTSGTGQSLLVAPFTFLGDIGSHGDLQFTFDARVAPGEVGAHSVIIHISGPGGNAVYNDTSILPPAQWTSYAVDFFDPAWFVQSGTLDDILADVTKLAVNLDLVSGIGPDGSLDNFALVANLPGDGNGDGWVDGLDYLLWAGAFGTHPGPDGDISDGDYNDDGWVDGLDYLLWAGNFGTHASTVIPEPSALTLTTLGLLAVCCRRRKRT